MMKWYYWVATGFYCAGIFYLSGQPELPAPPSFIPMADKVAHVIVFGGLAALVSVGLRRSNRYVDPRVQWIAPLVFVVLYGLSDEFHQLFVPTRQFDLWDLAADALGALIAQFILCGWLWRVHPRHGTPAKSVV